MPVNQPMSGMLQPAVSRERHQAVCKDGIEEGAEKKVLSVDVIIPAFNEERCIADALRDVSGAQESNRFEIKNVFVISDASTDKTEDIVHQIAKSDRRIKLVKKRERKGKQDSINMAFSITDADIVLFLDADVRLGNKDSIEKLISYISDDVAVVQGGLVRPHPGFTLNPASLAAHFDWLVVDKVRRQKQISWWSIDGRVMALARYFYKNLVLPLSLADDQFIFYSCIQRGYRFVWAQDAIFYYGPPVSVADFSHQWSRYFYYTRKSREYFGKDFMDKYMNMPGLCRTIVSCLLRHPICGLMWLLCYSISNIEHLLKVDFGKYDHGLFWTKSHSLKIEQA